MKVLAQNLLIGAAVAVLALTEPTRAQDYPAKPIHIIVGFAAGGGNDIIARVFGQKLSESLGQPVIVENKPGGGAIVATDYVAKSPPDGYTLLMSASGISINPAVYAKLPYDAIPYKSANESVLAVISGQVTTTIADAGPVIQQVKSGIARALAVATPKRIDDLPDVPTLKEAGADVDAVLWSGIFVPKGTPPAIVKKLEGELMRIAKLPDVINRLKPLGIDTVGNSSAEFAKILAADIARWSAVARAANIRMEQ